MFSPYMGLGIFYHLSKAFLHSKLNTSYVVGLMTWQTCLCSSFMCVAAYLADFRIIIIFKTILINIIFNDVAVDLGLMYQTFHK